jgi:hypothetical protein
MTTSSEQVRETGRRLDQLLASLRADAFVWELDRAVPNEDPGGWEDYLPTRFYGNRSGFGLYPMPWGV